MRLLVLGGSGNEGDDLIWPSDRSRMSGRPSPSQTVWSFEFSPPFVRPIRRGTSPF